LVIGDAAQKDLADKLLHTKTKFIDASKQKILVNNITKLAETETIDTIVFCEGSITNQEIIQFISDEPNGFEYMFL